MSAGRLVRHAAALLLAFAATTNASAAPMQQAFLVQNSGWMEPFYADPGSKFKPLIGAVVRAVSSAEDTVTISAFNQSTPENQSPALLYRGEGAGNPEQALASLGVATKNKSRALADTDFEEAVADAKRQFKSQPGIIWIFTNNKNSPNNDPQTLLRNEDFYRVLHLDPAITRTLAYPHKMPLNGKLYKASGMMVYALACGDAASRHLATLVDAGALAKVFDSPPARLKPIDQESVRLIPKGVINSKNVKISLAKDGRTLLVDVATSDVLPVVEIKAAFQNLFYPYVIAQARTEASLRGAWGQSTVGIVPAEVKQVQPGGQRDVSVTLPLPLAQIPSPWSGVAIGAMGKKVVIPAVLQISLADQRLVLSDQFKSSLEELFPGDPLSKVFLPPASVKSSSASVPLLIQIQYPLLPVVAAMLAALLALAAAIGAAVLAGRDSRYDVMVDGAKRAVKVKAFGTQQVRSADGTVVGSVKRGLGKPRVVQVLEGHTITVT